MKNKLSVYFTVFIALILSLFLVSFTWIRINQHQAIKLAEDLIRCNGYTNLPIDTSKHKLSYEMFDGLFDIESNLKRRHNTLYSKAFCIWHDRKHSEWHVGFLSSPGFIYSRFPHQKCG